MKTASKLCPNSLILLVGMWGSGVLAAQGVGESALEVLQRENRQLHRQLNTLRTSYRVALEREETKTRALATAREQFALFGQDFFAPQDERLRDAVADYQVAREKNERLETASLNLVASMRSFLETAVAADPDRREDLEVRLRELEGALGYRNQPQAQVERGTPQSSRVVTIDSESGIILINAGSQSEVKTGMTFSIERAGQKLAQAIVATVRDNVSGLFLTQAPQPGMQVQPGDLATILLETSQP